MPQAHGGPRQKPTALFADFTTVKRRAVKKANWLVDWLLPLLIAASRVPILLNDTHASGESSAKMRSWSRLSDDGLAGSAGPSGRVPVQTGVTGRVSVFAVRSGAGDVTETSSSEKKQETAHYALMLRHLPG
ncbi:MAG: hypothetical protein MHM6MM_004804, partial [Cercozoa sp. M6MM]